MKIKFQFFKMDEKPQQNIFPPSPWAVPLRDLRHTQTDDRYSLMKACQT